MKRPPREVVVIGIGVGISPTAKLIVTMPREGNVFAQQRRRLASASSACTGGSSCGPATAASARPTSAAQLTLDDGRRLGDASTTPTGDLDVDTGDGSVSVAGKLGSVKLHTGDGSITFRAEPGTTMTDDWSMTTGDGGVASTCRRTSARSSTRTPATARSGTSWAQDRAERERRISDRRTLRGKLGTGGKMLRIRTGDGAIRLKAS